MFKTKLAGELKNIFGIPKVSFAEPSDSNEQDVIFVNITACKFRPQETEMLGRITGKITVYSSNEKLPYGFFIKKIHLNEIDSKDLFFYNIEENTNYMGATALVERTSDFIYFYKESFDPNKGEITSLNF